MSTTAKGTVNITSVGAKGLSRTLTINNAYYCPEVSANLISFGQLSRNLCNSTTVGPEMTIFDPNWNPILYGRCQDDVFVVRNPDIVAVATVRSASLSTWHKRLGHTNYGYIEMLGDRIDIVGKDRPFCEPCTKGKQHKIHSKEPATHRTLVPGERWHVDLVGGGNTLKDTQGHNMSAILTDDATHRRFSYPVKTKDDAALKVQEHILLAEAQYGYICKQLHSDDDSIFKPIQTWLSARGIMREPSAPYAQDQDGISERSIRTLIEKARTMRIQAGLPNKLWTHILNAAAYLDALVPSSSLPKGKTPYQLYEKEMPDYSQLRTFGCTAYVLDYQAKSKGKLAARSHAGVLVGYAAKNQWLIWDGRSVKVRRDIVFDESNMHYYKPDVVNLPMGEPLTEHDVFDSLNSLPPTTVGEQAAPDTIRLPRTDNTEDTFTIHLERADGSVVIENQNTGGSDDDSGDGNENSKRGGRKSRQGSEDSHSQDEDINNTPSPPRTKRKTINRRQPFTQLPEVTENQEDEDDGPRRSKRGGERLDYKTLHRRPTMKDLRETGNKKDKAFSTMPTVPKDMDEALAGPDRELWIEAQREEIKTAMALKAWDLVEKPDNVRAIDGKWIPTIKTDIKGNFVKRKARWVARGFQQVKGVDYDQTYSATVRPDTTRLLLAIAAREGWTVHQMDVVVAYLNAQQKQYQIYLKQPKGFEHGHNLYCRMDKGLYGLKQSGNLWFDEATGTIKKIGLEQSKYDPALFFDRKKKLYITLYVDDFKAICPNPNTIKWFMKEFGSVYKLKDLGPASNYLGMEIVQDKEKGIIKVTQRRYLQHILEKFKMQDCKPAPTPMEEGLKLMKADKDCVCNAEDRTRYQELEGSLMHLSVQTRPDITQAVNKLGQLSSNPTKTHWTALCHVVRYLKGTLDYGLLYGTNSSLVLEPWTDSSWGDDPNDARSTHGYIFKLAGGPISWKSQKQHSVALSSAEAEYVGESHCGTIIEWFRGLLQELDIPGTVPDEPTQMYCDNQAAIGMAEKAQFNKKTKHIAIRYHYVRDLVQNGVIEMVFVPTDEMIADAMTKPVGKVKFKRFLSALNMD